MGESQQSIEQNNPSIEFSRGGQGMTNRITSGIRKKINQAVSDVPPRHLQGKHVHFYDRIYVINKMGDEWFLQQPPDASMGGTWLPIPWQQISHEHVSIDSIESPPRVKEFFDLQNIPTGTRASIQLTHARICDEQKLRAFRWVVTRLDENVWRFENGREWFEFSREAMDASHVDRPAK